MKGSRTFPSPRISFAWIEILSTLDRLESNLSSFLEGTTVPVLAVLANDMFPLRFSLVSGNFEIWGVQGSVGVIDPLERASALSPIGVGGVLVSGFQYTGNKEDAFSSGESNARLACSSLSNTNKALQVGLPSLFSSPGRTHSSAGCTPIRPRAQMPFISAWVVQATGTLYTTSVRPCSFSRARSEGGSGIQQIESIRAS